MLFGYGKDSGGGQAADPANGVSASADGKIAAFHSKDGLVPADTNGKSDVYFRGLGSNRTVLVSQSTSGAIGNADSFDGADSANGRFIAFSSRATNLIDGKVTSGDTAIYVRDRFARTTRLVSVNSSSVKADGECHSSDISAGGKLIVFVCSSDVTNMTGKNTNDRQQVYLRNLNSSKTILISRNRFGKGANGGSHSADLSNKAKTIVYKSEATNLGTRDTNGTTDIYRFRRLAGPKGKADRVSRNWKGKQLKGGDDGAEEPSISKDGRYLVFSSDFTNAIKGGISGAFLNIYRRDIKTGKLILVSRTGGMKANASTSNPFISANGKFVFFESGATNLIPGGDTNGEIDVLRRGPY